jgi:hypothetical protein
MFRIVSTLQLLDGGSVHDTPTNVSVNVWIVPAGHLELELHPAPAPPADDGDGEKVEAPGRVVTVGTSGVAPGLALAFPR